MASKKMIVTVLILGLAALAAGCSDSNTPVAATPDTAPPALPGNLDVAFEGGIAVISWAENTVDADLAGYIVTREHNGDTVTLVATPTLLASYEDPAPLLGVSNYLVYAVDTSGNESAAASIDLTIAAQHVPQTLAD
jgi:hypothetical protein